MGRQSHIYIEGLWDRIDGEIHRQNRTKAGLARQCGFDRKILMRDTSSGTISLPYFARLCSALNVSADYLLFGTR